MLSNIFSQFMLYIISAHKHDKHMISMAYKYNLRIGKIK